MSNRKHRKLKRHPLIRFVRSVVRLLRVLFRSKQDIAKLRQQRQAAIDQSSFDTSNQRATHSFDRDRLITVGELLGRVKWQASPPTIPAEISDRSGIVQTHDVSRN
jgi:hypothetical protein